MNTSNDSPSSHIFHRSFSRYSSRYLSGIPPTVFLGFLNVCIYVCHQLFRTTYCIKISYMSSFSSDFFENSQDFFREISQDFFLGFLQGFFFWNSAKNTRKYAVPGEFTSHTFSSSFFLVFIKRFFQIWPHIFRNTLMHLFRYFSRKRFFWKFLQGFY